MLIIHIWAWSSIHQQEFIFLNSREISLNQTALQYQFAWIRLLVTAKEIQYCLGVSTKTWVPQACGELSASDKLQPKQPVQISHKVMERTHSFASQLVIQHKLIFCNCWSFFLRIQHDRLLCQSKIYDLDMHLYIYINVCVLVFDKTTSSFDGAFLSFDGQNSKSSQLEILVINLLYHVLVVVSMVLSYIFNPTQGMMMPELTFHLGIGDDGDAMMQPMG